MFVCVVFATQLNALHPKRSLSLRLLLGHKSKQNPTRTFKMPRPPQPSGPRGPTISRQEKAGVTLSVARINKHLRKGRAAKERVSSRAPLYVAGVMEVVVDSIVKQAVENARNGPRNAQGHLVVKRVDNVDVINAVRSDPDLARLCNGFAFSSNAPAIKPVMHILSGAEQDKRRKAKALAKAVREAQRKTGLD